MRSTAIALTALATAVACGPSSSPQLDGLTDQVAQVGQQLVLQLDGTDPAGGRLAYAYDAPDVTDLTGNAQVTVAPSGEGVFQWTPLAADVGAHPFDFTVTNAGGAKTTVTITITVKSAIGEGSAPVFRQPLGTGTTIDIAQTPCVTLQVVIEDQASAHVTIAQEQPLIIGATLMQTDGQTATWKWCPTVSQAMESRYTLILSADDGQNPKTLKDYLVVVRDSGSGGSCPGAGPSISHSPADQTTRLDLALDAQVTDSAGLKDTPLLYYSSTDPGSTPNLSAMTQISATLASGDSSDGSWTATVPNPVAGAADGTAQTIYYVFVAEDHDQTDDCDHVVQSQVYAMTVTAGGSSTAGLCEACTADSQCGDGNECVYVGDMGDSYCLSSCDAGCPDGYSCSASEIYSVDGDFEVQCVPQSGSCSAPTAPCDNDDGWHPNQTMSEASANGVMDAGEWTDLISCPSPSDDTRAEDDWFKIELDSQSTLDLYLYGDGATDLDLHLYDSSGDVIDASISSTPYEELHECVGAYVYYIKVNGYGYARSLYELDIDETPASSCP
jgi:hypothetical protein